MASDPLVRHGGTRLETPQVRRRTGRSSPGRRAPGLAALAASSIAACLGLAGCLSGPGAFAAPQPAGDAPAGTVPSPADRQPLRFVMVSKVGHPWFEQVRQGAVAAALMLSAQTGRPVTIEEMAPERATIELQRQMLSRAIAS